LKQKSDEKEFENTLKPFVDNLTTLCKGSGGRMIPLSDDQGAENDAISALFQALGSE